MKTSYLKYFVSLLLFGLNGIVASRIHLSSSYIVFLRTLIGSIFLIIVYLLSRQGFHCIQHKKDLLYIVISGVSMGASWIFLFEAYDQIGVSIASLLYYCAPILVMALSPVLFGEKLTGVKVAGFFVVLAGVVCVNGNVFGGRGNLFGIFCGLMSAVLYTVMVITNKKSEYIKGMGNTVIQLVSGFLTVAVIVGIQSGYEVRIENGDWLWILILGIVNTGIGCYFYFSSIGNLPVQTVAVCGYLDPLSAVIFSVVLLHEKMLPIQVFGAVLILGGALFAECYKKKKTA
ncbi:DMT family transporter [Mediterraneibacter agrestimuris]|uniref:DMT family transporter n=1 Tax=Mediterraneibacter agrestimuris TaxID=2941333 RepID=UPI00203CD6C4|nr:DMT family transporter [Mediterraneibacter agrestimuris]